MKKYPSQIRYERSHPVVSARLDIATREKLREMLKSEGKTFAKFLKDVINEKRENWDDTYRSAYKSGYVRGKEDYQLWYPCDVCGEKIYMTPNSNSHKDMMEYMQSEGWGHKDCHKK